MAFDRTNQADLTALKNEFDLDPVGMGYSLTVSTQEILDLFNLPENNAAPADGADFVTPKNLLNALFPVAISSQDQFKIQLIFEAAQNSVEDISLFRDDVSALSTQIATAVAGITRPLSRAEVLFSSLDDNGSQERVTISREDWIEARENG